MQAAPLADEFGGNMPHFKAMGKNVRRGVPRGWANEAQASSPLGAKFRNFLFILFNFFSYFQNKVAEIREYKIWGLVVFGSGLALGPQGRIQRGGAAGLAAPPQ